MAITDIIYVLGGFLTPIISVFIWYLLHRALIKLRVPSGKKISITILLLLLVWIALSHILGTANIFRIHSYAVPFIAFVIPYVFSKIVSGSQGLSKAIDSLPNHFIIGVQIYRTLGILFLILYWEGIMPAEFAIPSGVGDIIIGVTAPVVAYLYYKRATVAKKLALYWNYFGILDLVIAMTVGPLTAPTLVQVLALNNPNEAILLYPMVTVPTFAVPFSFILHIISLRILKKK